MKITAKTTKMELVNVLGANASLVKTADKELFDRLSYASKMFKKDESKVTKKDLADLVRATIKSLGDKFIEPALAEEKVEEPKTAEPTAENSIKKLGKGLGKKQKSMEESTEEVVESETTEEPVKETKASKPSKSSKPKTEKKESKEEKSEKDLFPETLKVEGGTEYTLAHDITSMDDLYDALEKDEDIVFAFYYNKKMLKQAPYFYNMLGQPKSFDNDLDLATTLYVSEQRKIAYHISMYTEGCYSTIPEDFEEVEGVRYAGTMIYQIYRAV